MRIPVKLAMAPVIERVETAVGQWPMFADEFTVGRQSTDRFAAALAGVVL